jgi:hypothetical protein
VSAHVRENSLGFKSSLFIGNLSPTEPFSSCVIHVLWDHLPTRVSVFPGLVIIHNRSLAKFGYR